MPTIVLTFFVSSPVVVRNLWKQVQPIDLVDGAACSFERALLLSYCRSEIDRTSKVHERRPIFIFVQNSTSCTPEWSKSKIVLTGMHPID